MAEIALVSVRKPRLQRWADRGNSSARVALDLANKPETFLATVQMGMTLVGVFAGAFGERALSLRIESYLAGFPRLAPLVTIPNASATTVLRAFHIRPSEEPLVTEEEITVIMEQGAEAGLLEESEHETVRRLFRLSDRAVIALMKPRHHIVWLARRGRAGGTDDETGGCIIAFALSGRARSLDNVVGMVKEKDLLASSLTGRTINLTEAAQPPLFVPGAIPAFRLLEMFKKSQTHVALVVDEYGDVEGLVTINDFFEDLVGDVASADEPQERHAVQRPDGSWFIDGKMLVHDFKELLNLGKLPGEERGSYLTVGGFVMMQIGRVPVTGDCFEAAGFRFEVADMDGRRVDKVLVQPLAPNNPNLSA